MKAAPDLRGRAPGRVMPSSSLCLRDARPVSHWLQQFTQEHLRPLVQLNHD
jgi:hypothetical protein